MHFYVHVHGDDCGDDRDNDYHLYLYSDANEIQAQVRKTVQYQIVSLVT